MKYRKVLALGLTVALSVTGLAGCGNKNSSSGGSSEDIEIAYWHSGLGTKWLDNMVEAFEEKYPNYHVIVKSSSDFEAVKAPFGNEKQDTIDLYMANAEYNSEYSEPLDDILDTTIEGESKTIREKMDPAYLECEVAEDGKVYELTYGGGATGIIYNKSLFEKAGIEKEPRTSSELVSVCDTLYSSDIVPLCHFYGASYYTYLSDAWRMQYDGKDYFVNNFYKCVDENGKSPSKEVFTKKDGRYKVLEALEQIITDDYILSGSNTHEMTTMQTKFLQGECAMMVTGGWIANEMSTTDDMDNFTFMKTPVISSIVEKLTTVTDESDLRIVISAIDAVTDKTADIKDYQDGDNYDVDGIKVSASDWDYIYKARNTISTNYAGESMFIPTYANAKEGAKEFIKFMYSDEGCKIYSDATHLPRPIALSEGEIDTSSWSQFEKDHKEYVDSAVQIGTNYIKSQHEIFYLGGADPYAKEAVFDKFCAKNEADKLNADSAWELIMERVDQYYENTWLANIGK